MAEDYVEFHARSAFSFLEGSSLPEELISVCANLGGSAMALLDRDGVYGSPRFHMAAKKTGIKAHIGAEITVAVEGHASRITHHSPRRGSPRPTPHPSPTVALPLLVENRAGHQKL